MSLLQEGPPWVQNCMLAAYPTRQPNRNWISSLPSTARLNRPASLRTIPGQFREIGFVEMSTAEEATAAITALNGSLLGGRSLTVNEAKPMKPRSDRSGRSRGSGRFGGGGRSGGGYNRDRR